MSARIYLSWDDSPAHIVSHPRLGDPQKAWNVVLSHKPTKSDTLKVSYNHKKDAALEYVHTEGIAKITLNAPIKSGATVSAKLTLEKNWDL